MTSIISENNMDKDGFWDKVIKGDCWEWQGAKTPKGYGQVRYSGKVHYVHRLVYLWTHGELPEGMMVLHSCDNPSCVKPLHLRKGTARENSQDMVDRDRVSNKKGTYNGRSKLSDARVLHIRSMSSGGQSINSISAELDVSRGTVWNIVNRRSWTHI